MVADGLGTGAMRTVGGYLGTYTNQPMGFITNNTERVHIDTLGNVGIGTQVPAARLESDAPSNSGAAAISARGGSTSNSLNGGGGIVATGGLNNSSVGQGGTGVLATGGLETYPDQNFSTNGGTGIVGNGGQAFGDNSVGGDGGSFSGGNSPGIGGDGVVASGGTGATTGRAGYFVGWVEIQKDLYVDGSIFATNKDFRIDHPLAPADKYLYHASVESSEMMDIYTGNVMTSSQGEAMVVLPGWFEALNGDFRYQLTVIGQFAQAIIAKEISNNRFTIKTDKPNVRVSWQVTAVRHDAAALAHPLQVEVDKSARERGYYIHPDLYGAPEEKGIGWAGNPQLMKRIKADREKR
jgi:hypothetical protein